MTSLKALGMGDKNKMETVIGEEAERFCKIAEKMVADSRDGVLEVWVKQWIKFERCADKKHLDFLDELPFPHMGEQCDPATHHRHQQWANRQGTEGSSPCSTRVRIQVDPPIFSLIVQRNITCQGVNVHGSRQPLQCHPQQQ